MEVTREFVAAAPPIGQAQFQALKAHHKQMKQSMIHTAKHMDASSAGAFPSMSENVRAVTKPAAPKETAPKAQVVALQVAAPQADAIHRELASVPKRRKLGCDEHKDQIASWATTFGPAQCV